MLQMSHFCSKSLLGLVNDFLSTCQLVISTGYSTRCLHDFVRRLLIYRFLLMIYQVSLHDGTKI
jgi:hypothetical protein